MNPRFLGKTGIQIPEIGMGCWAIGGVGYGPVSEEDALAALETAWDGGVRFFDTADTYGEGRSENILARFLSSKPRDQAVIATKAGWDFYPPAGGQVKGGHKKNFDPQYLRFACDQSLKRLKVDCIDLYQLHNPKLEVLRQEGFWESLLQLKKEGKVRLLGVSLHTVEEALWALEHIPVDSLQVIYNILDQRMRFEVFPKSLQKGVAILAREPLACGILTGKYSAQHVFPKQDHRRRYSAEKMKSDAQKLKKIKEIIGENDFAVCALEFVLAEPAVSCVIPGGKNGEQVHKNLLAAEKRLLNSRDIDKLRTLFDSDLLFKEHLLPA